MRIVPIQNPGRAVFEHHCRELLNFLARQVGDRDDIDALAEPCRRAAFILQVFDELPQADGVPQTFLGSSSTGADLAVHERGEVIRGADAAAARHPRSAFLPSP